MKGPIQLVGLLAVMAATMSASAARAQPTIPRQQIPANLPPEVRKQVEALYSSDPHQRAQAAGALGGFSQRSAPAIPFLMAMFHDPGVLDLLATALKDEHPDVRADAARSLAELKDPRAVLPLIAALQGDDNGYVRWHAADALGELGDARAVGPLTKALEDKDTVVRARAREALREFDNAVDSGQF